MSVNVYVLSVLWITGGLLPSFWLLCTVQTLKMALGHFRKNNFMRIMYAIQNILACFYKIS